VIVTTRRKRPMASVFLGDADSPFIVAETPNEVAALVRAAFAGGDPLIELTLANLSDWNGKPLICRADRVVAACPPKDRDEDDDA
jgi:hypothetical protein